MTAPPFCLAKSSDAELTKLSQAPMTSSDSLALKTRVFLVDDHPLVSDWLSRLINEESDLEICGWSDNVDDAIGEVERLKPGITIVDISLRGKSGLELIRHLTDRNPEENILVLSMHDEMIYASRSFRAGARGYVCKREAPGKVVLALRCLIGGGIYVSEAFAHAAAAGPAWVAKPSSGADVKILSDRELEVFRLLAAGRETSEIARDLAVSLKTIQSYCARIKQKLGLRNATELLQAATRWADAQDGV
jgi:DNA-binding NarL/FixJ family response regulator